MVQPAGGSRSVLEAAMQGELPSCIPLLSPPPFFLSPFVSPYGPCRPHRLLDLLFFFLLIGTRCACFVISIIQTFPSRIVYFHSTLWNDVCVLETRHSALTERNVSLKRINKGGCFEVI